jgi:uncharacterized membrane protein (UPF0182 family)
MKMAGGATVQAVPPGTLAPAATPTAPGPSAMPAPAQAVAPGAQVETSQLPADLAQQARVIYQRAIDAQRAGDWARYGEELKRLGEVLDRLAQERKP